MIDMYEQTNKYKCDKTKNLTWGRERGRREGERGCVYMNNIGDKYMYMQIWVLEIITRDYTNNENK